MKSINNYEEFCIAFNSSNEKLNREVRLLLFMQDWILRNLSFMKEDVLDYSLRNLLDQNLNDMVSRDKLRDTLSNVIDNSNNAFRHLAENMGEKIIRENVKMPIHKVREINSYGFNWLSRQSGKTIGQKISSAGNVVMAVQRRMSFDTTENRLLVEFAKEMYDLLNTKLENVPKYMIRSEEERFRDELANFLHKDAIKEIAKWKNVPPNNTLLSDPNYKKIWQGWNELKKIDERIKDNIRYCGERLATIFFIGLLVYIKRIVKIPQQPVRIEYDDYKVHLCDKKIYGLDNDGNAIEIFKQDNCVYTKSVKNNINVKFIEDKLFIEMNNDMTEEYEVLQQDFPKYIKYILLKLGLDTTKIEENIDRKKPQKFKRVTIDLFSLHPRYIGDGQNCNKLKKRILQQRYIGEDTNEDEREYYIPCDNTNAIKILSDVTETYTIPLAVDNGSMDQMKRLMYMMQSYIITDTFTYVSPDVYNELQLSMIHKAARMVYHKVRSIPLSIGVAFKYQIMKNFDSEFKPNDFLLIINLIDYEVTFTLLEGKYSESIQENIKEYKGMVWERHITSTISFKKEIENKVINPLTRLGCKASQEIYKLLALEGLGDKEQELDIFFQSSWFQITPQIRKIVKDLRINITDSISEFLVKNKFITRDSNIHIISAIENLVYKGTLPYIYMSKQEILEGCEELQNLERVTNIPLWHDHLPALAIKQMYGKFELIRNVKVKSQFMEKQNIAVSGTFTLPKGCREYHFNLVQDENAREMQYEAVIRNLVFPLEEDIECDLVMTYQYGAEEPYELLFIPKDKKLAKCSNIKVEWKKIEEYPYKNFDYPEFPIACSWNELRSYNSKNGINDLLENLVEGFDNIYRGYVYFDFNTSNQKYSTYNGEAELNISGSNCIVSWNQKSWTKGIDIPQYLGKVSFLLQEDKREPIKRYRITDLSKCYKGNSIWFKNKANSYQCLTVFSYKGKEHTIALYETEFDSDSQFNTKIYDVSFGIKEGRNGNLKVVNIHDESQGPYKKKKRYFARGMCQGNFPPIEFASGRFNFSLYRTFSFSNNRSLRAKECPENLQNSFARAVSNWIDLYYESKDRLLSRRILIGMSLMARDIGKPYYKLLNEAIDIYATNKIALPNEVGCGLGDLSLKKEKIVLKHMINKLPENKMVFILSKALWHNEKFVYAIDSKILLDYSEVAINLIYKLMQQYKRYYNNNNKNWKIIEEISACMEYLLGVFRLRALNDDTINKVYLSLNNHSIKRLYKYLEEIIEMNIPLQSFLKLEVSNKGEYETLPNIVYALLVYITGQSAESEIKISGLNIDDSE